MNDWRGHGDAFLNRLVAHSPRILIKTFPVCSSKTKNEKYCNNHAFGKPYTKGSIKEDSASISIIRHIIKERRDQLASPLKRSNHKDETTLHSPPSHSTAQTPHLPQLVAHQHPLQLQNVYVNGVPPSSFLLRPYSANTLD